MNQAHAESEPLGPRYIGPYRIDLPLGAGGMGEVFRAWDARLERHVAIKIVRRDLLIDARRRERFRREALAAARLSHPAIVSLYDVLTHEHGDALVFEFVEGTRLDQLLRRGPLPVEQALALGAEIGRALAAAHASGVVHRDLKTENVLVTRDGHAKVLDFGLALMAGAAQDPLTEEGRVVGTWRAMSPEQARGLAVGPASDIFSLGVLLYEVLTARNPFAGDDAADSVRRLCMAAATPMTSWRPDLPAGVVRLVGHLLEKDPARRIASAGLVSERLDEERLRLRGLEPRHALSDGCPPSAAPLPPSGDTCASRDAASAPTGVYDPAASTPIAGRTPAQARPWRSRYVGALAVAALLAGGGFMSLFVMGRLRVAPSQPLHLAVPRPHVQAAVPEQAPLIALALRSALLRGAVALDGTSVAAPEDVDQAPSAPTMLAAATGADELLVAEAACGRDTCRVELRRLAGGDGRVLWSQGLDTLVDRPELLVEALQGHLRRAFGGRGLRSGFPALEVRPEDYAVYLSLWGEFVQQQRAPADLERLLARSAALRRDSPRFLEALVFEADVLRYRFEARRDDADLRRAEALLHAARDLAPDDPRPYLALLRLMLAAEQLPAAETALRELTRRQPAGLETLIGAAQLLDRQGHPTQALERLQALAARRPATRVLLLTADVANRCGALDVARQALEELLRRDPRARNARSLLAQIELLSGDLTRAITLYEQLLAEGERLEELSNLSLAYLLRRQYEPAEARLRAALRLEPGQPLLMLNLADVLGLQARAAEARAAYLAALAALERDPAAGADSAWQLHSARAQALAHLGRRREAVEAVQRVLRGAADNPQALFEAALVHALLGERSSSLAYAARARAGGVQARWFELAFFDALRDEPEFRQMLAGPLPAP
jgi:serine/threonine-protein kinase